VDGVVRALLLPDRFLFLQVLGQDHASDALLGDGVPESRSIACLAAAGVVTVVT